jgi:hypothetical protein
MPVKKKKNMEAITNPWNQIILIPVMLLAFVRELRRVRATHLYFGGELNCLIWQIIETPQNFWLQ